VKLDNWEMVEIGWPIEDYRDKINGKRSLFYFIKDVSEEYVWMINSSFLSTIDDQSKFLKISFKVEILILFKKYMRKLKLLNK
jgi:hypothetical protein